MEQPIVTEGQWIIIGKPTFANQIHGYIIKIQPDGTLDIGYYQNQIKAIKTEAIWDGEHWQFKYPGPHGSYLRGREEHIVMKGPPR